MIKTPGHRIFLILLLILLHNTDLFSSARQEAPPEVRNINSEFTLVICSPVISSLPVERQVIGNTVVRHLSYLLDGVDYRIRGEDEIAFYRDTAWNDSRTAVLRNIVSRRNERDLIIYRGDPQWRYERNLRTIDEAIKRLEDELALIEANPPVVEPEPVFRLSETNRNGIYPQSPSTGDEAGFISRQRADAFLTLDFFEYYDRIYLHIKLFTLYTNSYSYEDIILFAVQDVIPAIDEAGGRVAMEISGSLPAEFVIHAAPSNAIILVDNMYAGLGSAHIRTFSPSEVEISIYADNHVPSGFTLDLNPGEITEVTIDLTPFSYSIYDFDVPGSPGAQIYLGNLFVGEAPLNLHLPRYQFHYINIETQDMETGSAIIRGGENYSGNVRFTGSSRGAEIIFQTSLPVSPDDNNVERARRSFYNAYGAFWIILPVSLITAGIAGNFILANNYAAWGANHSGDYNTIYSNAVTATYVQLGANIAWVSGLALTFFQIYRYLRTAGTEAEPNVRHITPETRTEDESL